MAEPREGGEEDLIDGGKVMSLFDHLSELRSRIIKSFLGVLVIFGVAFAFSEPIIRFLSVPLLDALPESAGGLHFTGPLDVFLVSIKVSFLAGLVGGCPVWLYQFWKFFEPALYPKERKYILPFVFASSVLFFIGVTFCFVVIVPMTLKFLLTMGMEVGTPIITIKDYVNLLVLMIFGFGLVFETPVILVLMAMLDLISAEALSEHRRLVIVGILVVGAILTPSPDPVSQMAMAIPMYLMYEISILIIRFIKGKSEPETAVTTT